MKPVEGAAKCLPKVDYLHTLGESHFALSDSAWQEIYRTSTAFRYRFKSEDGEGTSEFIWLTDDVLLINGQSNPSYKGVNQQIVREGDWLHFQFRISGGGREEIEPGRFVYTPDQSCTLIRQPEDTVVTREFWGGSQWQVVCLYLRPRAITQVFGIPETSLPESYRWIASSGSWEAKYESMPLSPAISLIINDIVNCPFEGSSRAAYMRAKATELVAIIVHCLSCAEECFHTAATLSPAVIDSILAARNIMTEENSPALTLMELARLVNVSRTKLACGFKAMYGVSVQSFWRDHRLTKARDLLVHDGLSVTDVALQVGYGDMSSFSRAFVKKFGVLPRDCRTHMVNKASRVR